MVEKFWVVKVDTFIELNEIKRNSGSPNNITNARATNY